MREMHPSANCDRTRVDRIAEPIRAYGLGWTLDNYRGFAAQPHKPVVQLTASTTNLVLGTGT